MIFLTVKSKEWQTKVFNLTPYQDALKYLSKIRKSDSCIFSKYYLWSVNNQKMKIFYCVNFFLWRLNVKRSKGDFCQFLTDFHIIFDTKETLSDFNCILSNQTKYKCNIYIKIIKAVYLEICSSWKLFLWP